MNKREALDSLEVSFDKLNQMNDLVSPNEVKLRDCLMDVIQVLEKEINDLDRLSDTVSQHLNE